MENDIFASQNIDYRALSLWSVRCTLLRAPKQKRSPPDGSTYPSTVTVGQDDGTLNVSPTYIQRKKNDIETVETLYSVIEFLLGSNLRVQFEIGNRTPKFGYWLRRQSGLYTQIVLLHSRSLMWPCFIETIY